jgi:fructan beta-fructosidase
MSNWDYAPDVPANSCRGAMTLPRILSLKTVDNQPQLICQPEPALSSLRQGPPLISLKETPLADGPIPLPRAIAGDCLEIVAEIFAPSSGASGELCFELRQGGQGQEKEKTLVGYDFGRKELFVDRSRSGWPFPGDHRLSPRHGAPLRPQQGKVKLHIFLDRTSVEVFGNEGERVITELIFPAPQSLGLGLYASFENRVAPTSSLRLSSLEIFRLALPLSPLCRGGRP